MQNRHAVKLLISGAFLAIFVLQFIGRAADDNSLFSWAWAFESIDATSIYFLLIAGLAFSHFLSQLQVQERYDIPLLLLVSFASVVPLWAEPEIIVDASRYFTQAKHLATFGASYFASEWGRTILAWTDLPFIPFLYGLIFNLFGEHRYVIQLFTTGLFALTTMLTYLTGRLLWSRDVGFSAGIMLLSIPYLLMQVPLMLVDVPTMFFLMLSLYLFLKAVKTGGAIWITGTVSAIACTVFTKYSVWLMLSVLIIALIIQALKYRDTGDRRPILRGAAILSIAAILCAMILAVKVDVFASQIRLLREYQQPGLYRWGESFLSTFLFQSHPFIAAAALISLVAAIRKRDKNIAIAVWLLLLMVVFGIRRIRYTLPLFPMLTLMAGYGLQIFKQDELRRHIVYGTVVTSLVVAYFAYLPLADRMSAVNLQHAGAYLDTLDTEEVEVITLPPREPVASHTVSVPLLDLFTKKRIRYDYQPASSSPADIQRSPLRFTWEYRNPVYYSASPEAHEPEYVIVISDTGSGSLPEHIATRLSGYRLSHAFNTTEGIFRYSVGIGIFQKFRSLPVK